MEFLFVTWDGGGNLPPATALARRLVHRGHTVRFLGHRSQQRAIEAAGCAFWSYTRAPDADAGRPDTALVDDWTPRSPTTVFASLRDNLFFGPSAAFAADVLAEIGRRRTDVVAVDWMLFGACAAAERAGVPAAVLWHSIYSTPHADVPPYGLGTGLPTGLPGRLRDRVVRAVVATMWAKGLPQLNATRGGLGLPPLRSVCAQFDRLARQLVLSSAAFDFAALTGVALPDNLRYVGAQVSLGATADRPPGPPLVVAGLSSIYQGQEPLLRRIVAALGRLPVRGLVSTGPAIDLGGDHPDNVEVRAWAPHPEVLPGAALLITHAGHGSVMAGLAHGVPMLCLPMGRDQPDVAARVVHCGAGRRLSPKSDENAITVAVAELLDDPTATHNAQQMADAITRERAADRAVAELEHLGRR